MAAALTIATYHGSNDQRFEEFIGTILVGSGTYVPGGLALDSALQAALLPKTNSKPLAVLLWSNKGSGYIYQRIAATGNMMILQTPLSGSLTTAAPLSELLAGSTLSAVQADEIGFRVTYERNRFVAP
jgi:hypothetical protein